MILQTKNLSFSYGGFGLEDVSIEIKRGSICGLLGTNGSGKSTFFNCCMKFLSIKGGEIYVGSQNTKHKSPAWMAKNIAYVAQHTELHFPFFVRDIVLMGRSTHIQTFGTPSPQDVAIARQALADLGIDDLARRDFAQLSGGQRQLVLAARALATEAPIMLLDEPTSALDVHNQDRLLTLLHRLSRERGLTILFTTHQPNHALAVAHKTLLMTQPQARFGPTATVLTVDNLKQLFDIDMIRLPAQFNGQRFENIMPVYATQLGACHARIRPPTDPKSVD